MMPVTVWCQGSKRQCGFAHARGRKNAPQPRAASGFPLIGSRVVTALLAILAVLPSPAFGPGLVARLKGLNGNAEN